MDKIFGEFELWIRGRVEIWKRQDVKEDSCYLIMNDGYKIKIYSGYQDREGITLGKYLISKNGNKSKYIEKYSVEIVQFCESTLKKIRGL